MKPSFARWAALICLISLATSAAYAKRMPMDLKNNQNGSDFTSLAFGATFGIVADMSGLGSAIADGGVVDLNPNSLASNANIPMLLMADKDMALLNYSAQGTNAVPLQIVNDFQEGGPLIGLDLGFYAWYDLLHHLKVPVFFRLGFDYSFKISGGEQKMVLGPGPDQIATAGSFPIIPGGFEGGSVAINWNSKWMEIPFTVGVCWQFGKRAKIYGGLGLSWFHGGFSIDVAANDKYVAFLTSYPGQDALMITESLKENITFTTYGISVNMLLGFEIFVWRDLAVTVEYYMGGTMQTVFADKEFSTTAKEVMTMAVGGPDAASFDTQYVERFAYPDLVGGSMFKFGVKYYFDGLLF